MLLVAAFVVAMYTGVLNIFNISATRFISTHRFFCYFRLPWHFYFRDFVTYSLFVTKVLVQPRLTRVIDAVRKWSLRCFSYPSYPQWFCFEGYSMLTVWHQCYMNYLLICWVVPSVRWRCWLGGRKGIRPVKKTEWWGAGMVICLERGADLHIAQLMPLPLTVSCFSKIQIDFTFLVPTHPGSPGQRAVKRVCVAE